MGIALFAVLLSLHLVTFLIFFITCCHILRVRTIPTLESTDSMIGGTSKSWGEGGFSPLVYAPLHKLPHPRLVDPAHAQCQVQTLCCVYGL